MRARLARAVYRFGWRVGTFTFRLALRIDREAVAEALDVQTGNVRDAVAEAFVDLGEARRLAGFRE